MYYIALRLQFKRCSKCRFLIAPNTMGSWWYKRSNPWLFSVCIWHALSQSTICKRTRLWIFVIIKDLLSCAPMELASNDKKNWSCFVGPANGPHFESFVTDLQCWFSWNCFSFVRISWKKYLPRLQKKSFMSRFLLLVFEFVSNDFDKLEFFYFCFRWVRGRSATDGNVDQRSETSGLQCR